MSFLSEKRAKTDITISDLHPAVMAKAAQKRIGENVLHAAAVYTNIKPQPTRMSQPSKLCA